MFSWKIAPWFTAVGGRFAKSCINIAERLREVTNTLGGMADRVALAVANRVVLYNVPRPAPTNALLFRAIVLMFCIAYGLCQSSQLISSARQ